MCMPWIGLQFTHEYCYHNRRCINDTDERLHVMGNIGLTILKACFWLPIPKNIIMRLFTISALALSLLLNACGSDKTTSTTTATDTTSSSGQTAGNVSHDTMGTMNTNNSSSLSSIMQKGMDDMKAMPSTGNPDNDYAALMKAHHMSAIEAAQVQLSQGSDQNIKNMAQKMLEDQQKEVAELNTFLAGHSAHGGGDAFYKEVMAKMGHTTSMDHSGSIDKQFVSMMIPHHQGAIDMSKAYLKAGAHEAKLKTMANNIIAAQEKEIKQLNDWLAKN